MIAILCPTRGRPEQLYRMWASFARLQRVSGPWLIGLFGSVSSEELDAYKSVMTYGKWWPCVTPDGMPTAHKWNLLAQEAMKHPEYKLFMLGADDMYFETKGWDEALLDHYNKLENKIHCYGLQDSRDPEGVPHPIVSREWIEAMGYFCPPIFLHWQQDSWTVAIAKHNNVFTHLKEYSLVHDKPSDTGQGDATHNRIRSWGWRERDLYVAETCSHFLDVEKERLSKCLKN